MRPGGYVHRSYKPPGKDSVRALADARTFLASARSLDGVGPNWLAARYNLKPKTAEYELTTAKARRA